MGLFSKIKNILFDEDEEIDIPSFAKDKQKDYAADDDFEKEEKKRLVPSFKSKLDDDDLYDSADEDDETKEIPTLKSESSKSPFISFDADEFDKVKFKTTRTTSNFSVETKKDGTKKVDYSKYEIKEETSNKKSFKASPIISPIHGIMDKNYVKEDLLPKFKAAAKRTDDCLNVDSVRNKAFGTLEEDIESTIDDIKPENSYLEVKPDKTIDDLLMESIDNENDEDMVESEEDFTEEIITEEETPNSIEDAIADDTFEYELEETVEEQEDLIEKRLEQTSALEILDEIEKELDSIKDNKRKLENDTLENDLFELIDSMYEERKDGTR